jgi:ribosomal protein S18 acetylase RimI-like enzyme
VAEFAIWTVEDDAAAEAALESRGYRFSESTLAMGMELRDLRPAAPDPRASRPAREVAWGDWSAYRELLELPDFLLGADEGAYRIATVRVGGGGAEGMAFHHDGDCGIFNVGTTEGARRRGLGTAVMRALLDDAVARGCTTASLQSTPMAESLYTSLGFRSLERIREFVPA